MAILGNWVSVSGLRRTTPGFVHDLSVDVEAHDGIDRVEFAIVANGTPHSTLTASSRSIRTPNFSDQPSPLPGVASGMAPFDGYGVGLDLSTVPAGTIVVTATIYDDLGASYVLPETMTVYNDTDGGDRRPRTVGPYYVDGTSGLDTNTGLSWAQAFRTPTRAIQAARDGITGDVGGVRINYRGTIVDMAAALTSVESQTTGEWWCEHVADAAGAFINIPSDPAPIAPRRFRVGRTGGGVQSKHRWIGFRWGIDGIVSFNYGGTVVHWIDGGYAEAENYLGAGRWTVRYAYEGVVGDFFGWDGVTTGQQRQFSGVTLRGVLNGFEVHKLLYDCVVEDFVGIAAKWGSVSPTTVTSNFLMRRERYKTRIVEGYVRMDADVANGNGRPALVVTKPAGTTARITGPAGGYDFSIDAAALVGQSYYGLRFDSAGATNLSTGVGLIVTAVGNTAGSPWVEVTCPGAVVGGIPANTCSFYTARVATGMNYWNIHPDGVQIERPLVRGDVLANCAIYDAPNLQSYFVSGNSANYALLRNLRDDAQGQNDFNWFGASVTNSIFQNLTLCGQFQTSGASWAGTTIRNCVFGSAGGTSTSIPTLGGTVTHVHTLTGATMGTNSSSGAWFAGTHTSSPFPFEPSTGNKGTGTTALVDPSPWNYSGSGSTRGVLRNIGDLSWNVGVAVSGSGAAMTAAAPDGDTVLGVLVESADKLRIVPGAASGDAFAGALAVSLSWVAVTLDAATGTALTGAGDVTAATLSIPDTAAAAPDGTASAHALATGSAGVDVPMVAAGGDAIVAALAEATALPDTEAAAPDGTASVSVAVNGAFESTTTAAAATGDALTDALALSLGWVTARAAAPSATAVVEEVPTEPTEPEQPRRAAPSRRRGRGGWGARRPARSWRL